MICEDNNNKNEKETKKAVNFTNPAVEHVNWFEGVTEFERDAVWYRREDYIDFVEKELRRRQLLKDIEGTSGSPEGAKQKKIRSPRKLNKRERGSAETEMKHTFSTNMVSRTISSGPPRRRRLPRRELNEVDVTRAFSHMKKQKQGAAESALLSVETKELPKEHPTIASSKSNQENLHPSPEKNTASKTKNKNNNTVKAETTSGKLDLRETEAPAECHNGHLCRFDPDCGPINLHPLKDDAATLIVSCSTLEDALDESLDSTEDFLVEYPQQDDALLLHCRIPVLKREGEEGAIASITGIPEEFGAVDIQVSAFQGSITPSVASNGKEMCTCQAPHSLWERQDLRQGQSRNQQHQNQQSESSNTIHLKWADLRPCSSEGSFLFPSLTSVAHFFRCLLQSSHGASPWCPQESAPLQNGPRRIAVLFPGAELPGYLMDVRVGDICPSWMIYSISRVQVTPSWSPWYFSSNTETTINTAAATATALVAAEETMAPATLVIFKQLPPRPLLMLSRPSRVPLDESPLQTLPKGCLWEVYFEYTEEDEDSDDNKGEKKNESQEVSKKDKETTPQRIPHCRMTGPPYVSYLEDYKVGVNLQALLANWETIRNEALQIPQWTAWPETAHYSKATDRGTDEDNDGVFHPIWTVFPLCHCFPANKAENKKWIDQTCAFVPKTIQLLNEHLGPVLRTALFSRLDAETKLEAHTGWADLANHVIRFHLPLVVPTGQVCGTWVDGCVETHEEGRFLCFDDSKTHRAFNYSTSERIVLILDLARPDYLPTGTASGGHSDELDQFIAQMNI